MFKSGAKMLTISWRYLVPIKKSGSGNTATNKAMN